MVQKMEVTMRYPLGKMEEKVQIKGENKDTNVKDF
jgi:hypothetical protein